MGKSSVLKIPDWSGWPSFMEIYKRCEDAPYPDTTRAGFLLLFNGGFRASEALVIRKDQCKYNEEAIVIQNSPVLKARSGIGVRSVVIKRDELNPLADPFIDLIENCKGKYLFPKHTGFQRSYLPNESSSRMTLYRRISDIGLFPHSLRAYRAMMLVEERNFTVQDLVEWFSWVNASMAIHYTRTRDIAGKMGIKNLPI